MADGRALVRGMEHRRRLAILFDAASALPSLQTPDAVLEVTADRARQLLKSNGVQVRGEPPESSAEVRARVVEARLRQARRYRDCAWLLNASCPGPVLVERWPLEPDGQALIDKELSDGKLTRRGLTRVQRLAWTVADCSGVPRPGEREAEIALALRSDDSARSLPASVVRVAS